MLIDNTLCLDLTCTSSKRRTKDDFNPTALLCAIAKHFLRHSKQGAARDSQLEAHWESLDSNTGMDARQQETGSKMVGMEVNLRKKIARSEKMLYYYFRVVYRLGLQH